MINLQRFRIHRAHCNACQLWNRYLFTQGSTPAVALERYLKPSQILRTEGDIVVTECGFVTMAILPNAATNHGEVITIPGIDDCGRRGYLVLRDGYPPFHSLASGREDAIEEELENRVKAARLVEHFGGKQGITAAVSTVSRWTLCDEADFELSGLCRWGAESFLTRMKLLTIGRRFGLPKCLLQQAGGYGNRLVAASLYRRALRERKQHLLDPPYRQIKHQKRSIAVKN